jgi:hypothetical protein
VYVPQSAPSISAPKQKATPKKATKKPAARKKQRAPSRSPRQGRAPGFTG